MSLNDVRGLAKLTHMNVTLANGTALNLTSHNTALYM